MCFLQHIENKKTRHVARRVKSVKRFWSKLRRRRIDSLERYPLPQKYKAGYETLMNHWFPWIRPAILNPYEPLFLGGVCQYHPTSRILNESQTNCPRNIQKTHQPINEEVYIRIMVWYPKHPLPKIVVSCWDSKPSLWEMDGNGCFTKHPWKNGCLGVQMVPGSNKKEV